MEIARYGIRNILQVITHGHMYITREVDQSVSLCQFVCANALPAAFLVCGLIRKHCWLGTWLQAKTFPLPATLAQLYTIEQSVLSDFTCYATYTPQITMR